MADKINPVYDMDLQEYNEILAAALKKIEEFKEPEWAAFVKSGPGKSRPIEDPDFWHKRSASILRQIYRKGTVGVVRLRTRYGNKKIRGAKPEEFRKSGGTSYLHREKHNNIFTKVLDYVIRKQPKKNIFGSLLVIRAKKSEK